MWLLGLILNLSHGLGWLLHNVLNRAGRDLMNVRISIGTPLDPTPACTVEAKLLLQVIDGENHIAALEPIRSVELLDDSEESWHTEDGLVNVLQSGHGLIDPGPEVLNCQTWSELHGSGTLT